MAPVDAVQLLPCIFVLCLLPLSLVLLFVSSPWVSNGRSVPFPRVSFYFVCASSLLFSLGGVLELAAWVEQIRTGSSSLQTLDTAQRIIDDMVRFCLQVYMAFYIILSRPLGSTSTWLLGALIVVVSTASTTITVMNDANAMVVAIPALGRNMLLIVGIALPLPVLLYKVIDARGPASDGYSSLVAFLSICAQMQGVGYAIVGFIKGDASVLSLVQSIFMVMWIASLLLLSHYLVFAKSEDQESTYLPSHIADSDKEYGASFKDVPSRRLTISPSRRKSWKSERPRPYKKKKTDYRPSSSKSATSQQPMLASDELAQPQPRPMLVHLPSTIDVQLDHEGRLVSELLRQGVEAPTPIAAPSSFVPFLSRKVSVTSLSTTRSTPPPTSPPTPTTSAPLPIWADPALSPSTVRFHKEPRRPQSADDSRRNTHPYAQPISEPVGAPRHRYTTSIPMIHLPTPPHSASSHSPSSTTPPAIGARGRSMSPVRQRSFKDDPLPLGRGESPPSFVGLEVGPDASSFGSAPSVYSQLSAAKPESEGGLE